MRGMNPIGVKTDAKDGKASLTTNLQRQISNTPVPPL